MRKAQTNSEENSGPVRIGDRVSIRRRGKRKIYCADFWQAGSHRRRSLKTANLKIARQRAIQLEAELAGGDYVTPSKPVLVADAKRQFIESIKGAGRARKTVLAYDAECTLFTQFAQNRGVSTLSQITAKLFLEYRSLQQGKLAEKTVYTRLIILKTFINWCCGDGGLLDSNLLRRCKVYKPCLPPKFTPNLSQVNAVMSKASRSRLPQFALLAITGLRVTEMSMLRPQDVDLKEGWIHVVAREGWMPKTRRARKVPIHSRLRGFLTEYADTQKMLDTQSYFFSDTSDGSKPINVRTINVDLQAAAKPLGIPVSRKLNGLVIHSLRHFFETQAVDSGVPQFVVDQWMGHAGHGLVGRTYYGFSEEKSVTFMQQVKF